MKIPLLVLVQGLFLSVPALGQSNFLTYVFPVSAGQAEAIYRNAYDSIDISRLPSPIDSFRNGNEEGERTAGHYLYIRPELERLDINLKSYHFHHLEVRNNDRDLALELVDSLGRARTDADIQLNSRSIPFDQNTQTYRRRNWHRDGLLTVAIDGDTLFYELEDDTPRPLFFRRINYWKQSKVGYWLTTPVRWISNSYRYLERGIGWGDWHFYRDPLGFLKGSHGFRGYIAGNQPMYRPGDTLKLKAYLAKQKGKPWSKPVRMRIWSNGSIADKSRTFVDSVLTTEEPGHFAFEWPLGDTLPLDQQYTVHFGHTRRYNFDPLSHRFRLEDYELDEANFSLELKSPVFHRGETVTFQTEGKDQNDQTVAGAEVRLTLMVKSISRIYEERLRIPDTLWTQNETLRDRESTQLSIPDSIFPAADMELTLYANFIAPSGEMHPLEKTFHYRHQVDKLILKLEGDSLIAGLERNGIAQNARAILSRSGDRTALPPQSDTISLPYREAISPYFEKYELQLDSLQETLNTWLDNQSLVSIFGEWQPDTITITYRNPRRLNISWLLQSRTKEIRRSGLSDVGGIIKVPVGDQGQWKLSHQYFWQYPRSEEQIIYRLDKQLAIDIEQPAKVSPGETVQIRVKVQDQDGKAAPGVQLTAAGINTQFGNTAAAYKAPTIPYRRGRDPFVIENFRLQRQDAAQVYGRNRSVNRAWYQKLDLQQYPFYQMRFDNSGIWTNWDTPVTDTFYQEIAQVAPFLIKAGRAVPVYLIYINNELVYYFASRDDPPYSFVGRSGFNRISLRTRDREYVLDSVWLEPGKKLDLAINLDLFKNGMSDIKMTTRVRPDEFTYQEISILHSRALVLTAKQRKKGKQYFWDSPTNIHALSPWIYENKEEGIIVPFRTNTHINYLLRGGPERTFTFEPGFSYDLDYARERLYEWDARRRFEQDFESKTPSVQRPGELIYRPEDINREPILSTPILPFNLPAKQRISGKSRLQLLQVSARVDSLSLLGILLQSEKGTEWIFDWQRQLTGDLLPGDYQVFIVREDSLVQQLRFELSADATLVLDLSHIDFIRDTLRNWPGRLFETSPTRQLNRENTDPLSSGTYTNPFEGNGRLIRGRITDENGEPLIGASILVPGSTAGTVTDFDGYYSIWVPDEDVSITVSYTGFSSQELAVSRKSEMDVRLGANANLLQEVVVVGYGTQMKRDATGAIRTVQASGLNITPRNSQVPITIQRSTSPGSEPPIIIINGRIISMDVLNLLPPDAFDTAEKMDEAAAEALYGSRAANGVYLITLAPGVPIPTLSEDSQEPAGRLRDQFRDYAFWQPRLVTDRNGEAYFQATFPDNITAWQTYVLGMDRRQRAGVGLARTQAWQSLTARLNVPRFLIAGDEVEVVGQAVNYTQDTLSISTFFRQGDRELIRSKQQLTTSLTDSYRIDAPTDSDSIDLIYGLEQDNYQDGEKRSIPIFQPGSLETEGHFLVFHGDTSLELSFDRDFPIQVFLADNVLEVLLKDLDYLKDYPHECMEQTASRLIALSLEREARLQLDQEFKGEGLLRKLIRKLEKAQLPDGSWGWWPGNSGSLWITRHVTEALRLARSTPELSDTERKAIRFIVNELPEMSAVEQLLSLDLLSGFQEPLDYATHLKSMDTLRLSLHDQLLITRIRQRADLPYQLDTLDKYKRESLYGALFWGESLPTGWWYRRYDHPIGTTLIAYDLLKGAGRKREAEQTLQYFLENRGIGQLHAQYAWYNTFETARVLAAILPDLLEGDKSPRKNRIQLAGTEIDRFPYSGQLPAEQQLQLTKTGTGPLYFTAYQQYHNRQPEPKSDVFTITSRLRQNERVVDSLEQGQLATLEVSLENAADAEYVMLEIPIPAACSYAERGTNRPLEDHREYRREKVVIYCGHLPAGTHQFAVKLEARFSGQFTLNPARAELMYFPVLFGRGGMRGVRVW